MNQFISAQCKNMKLMVQTFSHSCKMAAFKDDGQIDRDEEKTLKKINKAADQFLHALTEFE